MNVQLVLVVHSGDCVSNEYVEVIWLGVLLDVVVLDLHSVDFHFL